MLGRALTPKHALPKYFKYREAGLVPIRSQGKCASCWAFAVTDVIADRISIFTGGKIKRNLSVQELLSCMKATDFNCKKGGIPEIAYMYPMMYGLVTEEAFPYQQENGPPIPPCSAPNPVSAADLFFNRSNLSEKYPDRVFVVSGSNRSLCVNRPSKKQLQQNIINMKTEIFLNGPIVGTLMVYDDLYEYDAESLYMVGATAKFKGGHAIEIFGWSDDGENTDEPGFEHAYWICRNSWGKRWPKRMEDKYGWFYVRMGTNEAGIENRASSCLPVYTPAMQMYHREAGALRENVAYTSYTQYVSDPERENFFSQLKRRRS
jgi:cathepsin B